LLHKNYNIELPKVVRQNNKSVPIVVGQNNNSLPIVAEPIDQGTK
jgi:hypothetical protein